MKKWFSITLGMITAIGGFLDAGTIATAGEAGAKFALGLVWAIVLATIAVMLLVEMIGRFSAISQKTYADAIRENFGFRFFLLPLCSEVIAESLLLTAELGGMAIALSMLTGISWQIFFPFAALIVLVMAWRAPFNWIENVPAILGLTTLAFVVAVFVLGGPPRALLPTLWQPLFKGNSLADYFYLVAAILGSTISPYLLYFYSSGALEEGWSGSQLLLNRVAAYAGMGFGSLGSLALVMLAAIVLHPLHNPGGTLEALGLPLSRAFGGIGRVIFAVALFSTCLGAALEVVLAVSYLIAQGFGWEWGKNKKPVKAARFNLVIILFLCIALLIGLLHVDPLQMALLASVVIALFLPISLLPFLVLMNDRQYLGTKVNRRWANLAILAILAIAFVVALVSLPLQFFSGG